MNDPLAPEDMAHLERALAVVRDFDMQAVQPVHHALPVVLAEYDRMRRKLDQIANGETVMILSDEDRAKAVMDLDDAALVAWVRPTLVFLHNAQTKIAAERGTGAEITSTIAMQGVISMASLIQRTNAGKASYRVSGITDHGVERGDWAVTIEHVTEPTPDERMVILVACDSDETPAGYCVINEGTLEAHEGNLFDLFYNDGPGTTVETYQQALTAIEEGDGVLVNVHAVISF